MVEKKKRLVAPISERRETRPNNASPNATLSAYGRCTEIRRKKCKDNCSKSMG